MHAWGRDTESSPLRYVTARNVTCVGTPNAQALGNSLRLPSKTEPRFQLTPRAGF